jgi:large subunit ribosomal protein L25
MEQTVVKAMVGRELGTRPSRRLRAEGKLPGVVYGLGKDPVAVSVEYTDLRAALTTQSGMNAVFTLDVEGDQETVLVRSVQRDPIKRVVTHADFLRVDPESKVKLKVPIELVGDASAVTDNGGLIEQKMFEIEIEVRPDAIPEKIEADLSIMTLNRGIAVADLVFPDGVVSAVEPEISVVTPVVPRSAKAAAGDEAEDGEGEGDAAAGGGDGDSAEESSE